MGDLGRSNFGAGKGVDFRNTSCDSAIFVNNTFVNFQDRIIRHRSSTAAIENLIFDHNTLVNGMSYHGTLALGWVGGKVQITNNLFLDTFVAGQDTDAVRQSEFDECEELDEFGLAKMTWISSVVNDSTTWTVKANYYGVSAAVQTFYDGVMATDGGFKGEGDPLTDHIAGKPGVKAFIKEAIEVTARPEPMVAMAEWYRSPLGGNKTKVTTNFNRATDDYDRRNYQYFNETFDCSYATTLGAYIGGTDGLPAGDLNWFPDATPYVAPEEELFVPGAASADDLLNTVIAGDTTATGERTAPNRVYVLARDGIYFVNTSIRNDEWPLKIKAQDGAGTRPVIYAVVNPVSGSDPGDLFRIKGDICLKDLIIVGFLEADPEGVATIGNSVVRTDAAGYDIVIDGCLFTQCRGQFVRTESAARIVKITNTMMANMGDLGRSNFGAGKGVDFRNTSCDSAIFINNTFVNFQDRIIRHRSSTAAIENLIFDHNTLVNGMSYHGTLALGWVGEKVQITNNLFLDTFVAGQDTDAVRQSEFDECEELDEFGLAKMTWISSVINDSTSWDIKSNYYGVSPAVQAFYDGVMTTDGGFKGEGDPLTDHIAGKAGVEAFVKEAIEVTDRPEPMVAMAEWYRSPLGGNKTKVTTNFNRATDDYDRRNWQYFDQTFDCSYATTLGAYTGGTDGKPVGDPRWVTAIVANDPEAVTVKSFRLAQNYPNPFNPTTRIMFDLEKSGFTTLVIYNMLGQVVATPVAKNLNTGRHEIHFDASDLANGVYFYRLQSGENVSMKKMLLLK